MYRPSPSSAFVSLAAAVVLGASLAACPEASSDPPPDTVDRVPAPSPVSPLVPRPGALLVHVSDPAGLPLEGASVSSGGRSTRTDDAGDAQLWRMVPGGVTVVVSAPGFVDHVRAFELPEAGLERHPASLVQRASPSALDASVGGSVVDGGVSITVEAGALAIAPGDPWAGTTTVWLTDLDIAPEFRSNLPGATVGQTADGTTESLRPVGAFELRLADPGGYPLRVAPGARAQVELEVPAESGSQVDAPVSWWRLDLGSGVWRQDGSTEVALVEEADGSLTAVGEIAASGVWMVAEPLGRVCCVRVDPELPDDLEGMVDLRLGASGGARSSRLPAGALDVHPLPCSSSDTPESPIEASLLVGGVPIASTSVNPVVLDDDGSCPDAAAFLDVAPGLLVALRAGPCSAAAADVRVRGSGGDVIFEAAAAAPALLVPGLADGEYQVEAVDPDDGTLLASVAGRVEGGQGATLVDLPDSWRTPGPGGCAPFGCRGDECDTCANIEVLDEGHDPVAGAVVNLYSPVDRARSTDDDGSLCVDIAGGADQELALLAEGGYPASVLLPRDASCSTGGCGAATVYADDDSLPCPPGTVWFRDSAREMGFESPAYAVGPSSPAGPATSIFRFDLGDGAGLVESLDAPWAVLGLHQDPLGVEWPGPLVIHDGAGLSLRIAALESLAVGQNDAADLALTVVIDPLDGSTPTPIVADVGTLEVIDRSATSILLDFDLVLATGQHLVGSAAVPIVEAAAIPPLASSQKSHHLNGAWVSVIAEDGDSRSFGPSGRFEDEPDASPGDLDYCVPASAPFQFVGKPFGDRLVPFSAIQRVEDLVLVLDGNDSEAADINAAYRIRWFDRSYVAAVHAALGAPPGAIGRGATILGVARRWDPETQFVIPIPEFEAVYLEDASGDRIDGAAVRDDFSAAAPGDASSLFVFVDVPPRELDDPWTLHLLDEAGAEVLEYRQRIAPIAGGVMITHN